ncbi:MAG TPA: Mu-like prophage major head subunit gpT family protein, partial [candidate division Zixibacteria bacterium]|nr:Mu-like prophage major head subunit gpT family protein [candidate division Zixibacteria bacterium]
SILNNGFDSSYTGGDGLELLSTAHLKGVGGTWSNELATSADLSETSLETLAIQIANATDDRGIKIMLRPKCLVVPPDLEFVTERLLGGRERPGTAERDINAMHKRGTIPDWKINHYLTDTDAFFVLTDADGGLQHFKRKPIKRGVEGDFETGNMRYKARERYVFGWHDARGVFGSPGA